MSASSMSRTAFQVEARSRVRERRESRVEAVVPRSPGKPNWPIGHKRVLEVLVLISS